MNRHPAVHCAIHLDIEPGHEIDGREPAVVLWTRSTYLDDYAPRPGIMTAHHEIIETPDPLPSWVPRPPAAWLAISEELRDAATAAPLDGWVTQALAEHDAGADRIADRIEHPSARLS